MPVWKHIISNPNRLQLMHFHTATADNDSQWVDLFLLVECTGLALGMFEVFSQTGLPILGAAIFGFSKLRLN